jgi:hypothetical protein
MKAGRRLRRTRQGLSVVLGAGARRRLRICAGGRLCRMTRELRAFHQTRSADVGQGWRAHASKCLHGQSGPTIGLRLDGSCLARIDISNTSAKIVEPGGPDLCVRITFSKTWQRLQTTKMQLSATLRLANESGGNCAGWVERGETVRFAGMVRWVSLRATRPNTEKGRGTRKWWIAAAR